MGNLEPSCPHVLYGKEGYVLTADIQPSMGVTGDSDLKYLWSVTERFLIIQPEQILLKNIFDAKERICFSGKNYYASHF